MIFLSLFLTLFFLQFLTKLETGGGHFWPLTSFCNPEHIWEGRAGWSLVPATSDIPLPPSPVSFLLLLPWTPSPLLYSLAAPWLLILFIILCLCAVPPSFPKLLLDIHPTLPIQHKRLALSFRNQLLVSWKTLITFLQGTYPPQQSCILVKCLQTVLKFQSRARFRFILLGCDMESATKVCSLEQLSSYNPWLMGRYLLGYSACQCSL